MQYVSIAIAIVSLLLSLYAVRLGSRNRSYDLLFKFYSDLKLNEPNEVKDISDIIPPEPEDIDEDERYIRDYNCNRKQEHIEAKFNLLCFAVIKGQIPLNEFFALFANYLQARMMFWPRHNTHRIGNYFYTSRVIDKCIRMKLLPLNQNKSFKNKEYGEISRWKDGSKALEEFQKQIKTDKSS
ncbi:MAG: hypothetical protein C4518_11680 [Desulfobacteraceae bacterium]|nr:MAG: hypothetical protein C4518_11680 [Desulfobacteraceae bacterium]